MSRHLIVCLAALALGLASCSDTPQRLDVDVSDPPPSYDARGFNDHIALASLAALPVAPTTTTTTTAPPPPPPRPTVAHSAPQAPVVATWPTPDVWDRLAQCESGGNWAANTGNGYYGGLQFAASTWRRAGGGQYAPYAHQATREQQIAVAHSWWHRIAAESGPAAAWRQWPTCSRRLGLR